MARRNGPRTWGYDRCSECGHRIPDTGSGNCSNCGKSFAVRTGERRRATTVGDVVDIEESG